MPRPEVIVITVQYGNPSDTATLVESLARVDRNDAIELVIVDNAPSPAAIDPSERLPQPFPIRRLEPGSNVYYWGGAELALRSIEFTAPESPSWVMICNNDIEVTDTKFIATLLSLDPSAHPILAPSILSSVTRHDQNPMLRNKPGAMTRLRWAIYDSAYPVAKTMLAIRQAAKIVGSEVLSSSTPMGRQRIYAPHGACVVLSSEFFRRGGTLDTTVPLFAEELTLAVEAARLRLPVFYLPQLQVVHREHSTTGNKFTRAKYDLERRARKRFYEMESRV